MIAPEFSRNVHDCAGSLQAANAHLEAAILHAGDATPDERVKMLGPIASGCARMLDAIDVATRPDPQPTTENPTG